MGAAEDILQKAILPTELSSAEIRAKYARALRERSFFSARVAEAGYLQRLRDACAAYARGDISAADARLSLTGWIESAGFSPDGTPLEGAQGLGDPRSQARMNLIIKTQRETAASLAKIERSRDPAVASLFPAWELVRFAARQNPRQNWTARWNAAGDACGWEGAARGRMVALKTSPIWQELGAGAGGYNDTLGNPYPPFAWASGMDWREVPAAEAESLGLSGGAAPASGLALSDEERAAFTKFLDDDMKMAVG